MKNPNDPTSGDHDEDLYPVIKVTRGGELPEGVSESGNEDNDQDEATEKNKKFDPHRALNIDLDEKAIPIPTPPPPPPPPVQKSEPVENPTEKTKKPKKKKTDEKEEKPTKTKQKRERGDYKELLSPADEEKRIGSPSTSTAAPPAVPTTSEEKPKKKKTKSKEKTSTEQKASSSLLFDIMNDDTSSNQQYNEESVYKQIAQSDNLTIVNIFLRKKNQKKIVLIFRNLPSFQIHLLLN